MSLMLALLLAAQPAISPAVPPGEEAVAPYAPSDANAGATPFRGDAMLLAFHGREGIDRVVEDFVAVNMADPQIGDIFRGQDHVRLRRVLKEQFCYILGGGCAYSGRDMRTAHRDMGVQMKDMNRLVANLQTAMTREGVAFSAQNAFLSKLAPMAGRIVER